MFPQALPRDIQYYIDSRVVPDINFYRRQIKKAINNFNKKIISKEEFSAAIIIAISGIQRQKELLNVLYENNFIDYSWYIKPIDLSDNPEIRKIFSRLFFYKNQNTCDAESLLGNTVGLLASPYVYNHPIAKSDKKTADLLKRQLTSTQKIFDSSYQRDFMLQISGLRDQRDRLLKSIYYTQYVYLLHIAG